MSNTNKYKPIRTINRIDKRVLNQDKTQKKKHNTICDTHHSRVQPVQLLDMRDFKHAIILVGNITEPTYSCI